MMIGMRVESVRWRCLSLAVALVCVAGCERAEVAGEKGDGGGNEKQAGDRVEETTRVGPGAEASAPKKVRSRRDLDEVVRYYRSHPKVSAEELRAGLEKRADDAGVSKAELMRAILDEDLKGRDLSQTLAVLRSALPEPDLWGDVVAGMPECEARSGIVSLYKWSRDEESVAALQKIYAALPPCADRTTVAFGLVQAELAGGELEDAMEMAGGFSEAKERTAGLKLIARRLSGELFNNPDSEALKALADDVRRQAAGLAKVEQLVLDSLLVPRPFPFEPDMKSPER